MQSHLAQFIATICHGPSRLRAVELVKRPAADDAWEPFAIETRDEAAPARAPGPNLGGERGFRVERVVYELRHATRPVAVVIAVHKLDSRYPEAARHFLIAPDIAGLG